MIHPLTTLAVRTLRVERYSPEGDFTVLILNVHDFPPAFTLPDSQPSAYLAFSEAFGEPVSDSGAASDLPCIQASTSLPSHTYAIAVRPLIAIATDVLPPFTVPA